MPGGVRAREGGRRERGRGTDGAKEASGNRRGVLVGTLRQGYCYWVLADERPTRRRVAPGCTSGGGEEGQRVGGARGEEIVTEPQLQGVTVT